MDFQQCTNELDTTKEKAQQFEFLSAGVNQLPIPLHIIDTTYTITSINEAAATLIGKKREDVIGKRCSDIYRSGACNTPECPCRIAMEKGIPHHCEITLGERIIDGTGVPMTDSTGRVIGAIEYFSDVTGQKKAVTDIVQVTEKVKSGDLLARTDLTIHTGDFKKMAEEINSLLDIFVEKNTWYKAIIDAVPFPIHVTDMEMKWTLMNSAFEKVLIDQGAIKDRDSSMGMPCFTANATICNTDNCGIRQLQKGVPESYFDWGGRSFKQATSFLNDKKGVHIGYVEVVQDLTSILAVRDFTRAEVDRMAANLSLLAEGNLNFNLDVRQVDEFTLAEHADFLKMNESLQQVQQAVSTLINDGIQLTESTVKGNLSVRADASRHKGDFKRIIEGFNDTLDAIILPIEAGNKVLCQIRGGDLSERMEIECSGDHQKMKDAINGVHAWLNDLIAFITKIANGDLTANINKSSEHDQVHEWLMLLKDNINALVADTEMLSGAAVEGKLAIRADATKHQGDFRKIIEGFNKTLDAVIEPVNEAMRVANEFSQYNYKARTDKNLKVAGDFIKFRDALDNIGISISAAIGEISVQVTDLAASAEEANASIEEVISGAQQVAESAGKVSSNAEKGNQGLEQVLKAMEDLSAAVEEVTASSESVATLANGANTLSKDGAELARKAEQGMVGITRSTTEVDQIIGEIKVEMQKIGKIVGLISDLANQTNLLALNAAIEAARAGDAGRGFAVVAAEVKSLAQESRTSAESIAEMIGGLQHKSELAAQATASASKEVGEGSAVLSETLNIFNRIVGDIEKITRSVEEVASASEEQAATVEEITASVHEVSSLVDGTASDAGDAAAASEESSAAIDEVGKIIENVNIVVDKVSMGIGRFRV
ncbi:methyl-accepting chemotaxis protein [Methanosphaerula palustris]|uniref:Methyl-accepting chemotaxis sensory transducer with Pas/Pac sensor n=1 Tax=Methanosphaerula palustris (strain ATCC BAA-1556 / DSM 19958 / E1-9c) TaxID=521011 RepID=B8GH09_METPE|nr:methyl-accepting chemotaxis protein [Methanosphaerula palustris]ACL16414.1 methyl-accepting chemotaxis sensory transducer with Pas/Pac sensor [Methanosphaerula palustris E1-9c]